jgi:hypothetical protein
MSTVFYLGQLWFNVTPTGNAYKKTIIYESESMGQAGYA